MIRGIYTGASGMAAQEHCMNAISNNLANVDVNGYKRDMSVHKAFPELLLRRMSDDGVRLNPWGSSDSGAVTGRLGLGIEQNEVFTDFSQGSFKETGNDFDVALEGDGFFVVDTPRGERYTRNGTFVLGREGYLVTKDGHPVLGENGPIRLKKNNFTIDEDGRIFHNAALAADERRLVSERENEWENTELLDRLRIVSFRRTRYLQKEGSSYWRTTNVSGPAEALELRGDGRPKVHQGFVETSNVNPIVEMVRMIEVNRAYEANQKTIQSQDALLGRLINEAGQHR